ncbi:hypothetical protein ACYULU_00005 [Breznakiellaceae bacterium SP9]
MGLGEEWPSLQQSPVELYKLGSSSEKAAAEMSKRERWSVFFQYYKDTGKQDLIQELVKAEEGISMAEEMYSGITQDAPERARLLSLWKGQMDIQSKLVTAAGTRSGTGTSRTAACAVAAKRVGKRQ